MRLVSILMFFIVSSVYGSGELEQKCLEKYGEFYDFNTEKLVYNHDYTRCAWIQAICSNCAAISSCACTLSRYNHEAIERVNSILFQASLERGTLTLVGTRIESPLSLRIEKNYATFFGSCQLKHQYWQNICEPLTKEKYTKRRQGPRRLKRNNRGGFRTGNFGYWDVNAHGPLLFESDPAVWEYTNPIRIYPPLKTTRLPLDFIGLHSKKMCNVLRIFDSKGTCYAKRHLYFSLDDKDSKIPLPLLSNFPTFLNVLLKGVCSGGANTNVILDAKEMLMDKCKISESDITRLNRLITFIHNGTIPDPKTMPLDSVQDNIFDYIYFCKIGGGDKELAKKLFHYCTYFDTREIKWISETRGLKQMVVDEVSKVLDDGCATEDLKTVLKNYAIYCTCFGDLNIQYLDLEQAIEQNYSGLVNENALFETFWSKDYKDVENFKTMCKTCRNVVQVSRLVSHSATRRNGSEHILDIALGIYRDKMIDPYPLGYSIDTKTNEVTFNIKKSGSPAINPEISPGPISWHQRIISAPRDFAKFFWICISAVFGEMYNRASRYFPKPRV